jgi:conjugative relaxase-like TrwC/TraI family protein
VVANLVHAAEDDRWSALDGRPLYQWCRTIGHLYQWCRTIGHLYNAELRHELTRRLGVEWHPVKDGLTDIAGVPRHIIDAFSTRSAEIEADLAEHGLSGAKAAQDAVYFTRAAKTYDVNPAGLITRWRNEAEVLGLNTDALAATLDRARTRPAPVSGSAEADELFARMAGPEGLTAMSSMFGRRDVIEAI